jgi:hypothetical protein
MRSIARGNETILPSKRNQAETDVCSIVGDPTRGLIMVAFIINLFYRQSCRAALSAIRMQSQIRL